LKGISLHHHSAFCFEPRTICVANPVASR